MNGKTIFRKKKNKKAKPQFYAPTGKWGGIGHSPVQAGTLKNS